MHSREKATMVLLPLNPGALSVQKMSFDEKNFEKGWRGNFPLGEKPKSRMTRNSAHQESFSQAIPALRRPGLHTVVVVSTGLIGSDDTSLVKHLACVWNHGAVRQQIERPTLGLL